MLKSLLFAGLLDYSPLVDWRHFRFPALTSYTTCPHDCPFLIFMSLCQLEFPGFFTNWVYIALISFVSMRDARVYYRFCIRLGSYYIFPLGSENFS